MPAENTTTRIKKSVTLVLVDEPVTLQDLQDFVTNFTQS